MSDDTYTPKAGSLAEKVCNYFRIKPGATLTLDEIRQTFMTGRVNIPLALENAIADGWIRRPTPLSNIFAAGPMLPGVVNPSVISQPKPSKGTGRGHSKLAHFDIDAIQVDKGVPIPSGTVRKKHESKWAPLLAKLTAKGDSVALPDQYRGTIDSYIRKLTKARPDKAPQFRTGRDDNGVTRIWRIA
jgi:hypothetical protein